MLEHVEHDDTFAVLTAGTTTRRFSDGPVPATPENVAAAVAFLEQTHLIGALDLGRALTDAEPLLQGGTEPVPRPRRIGPDRDGPATGKARRVAAGRRSLRRRRRRQALGPKLDEREGRRLRRLLHADQPRRADRLAGVRPDVHTQHAATAARPGHGRRRRAAFPDRSCARRPGRRGLRRGPHGRGRRAALGRRDRRSRRPGLPPRIAR